MAPVALAFAVLEASNQTADLGVVLAAHMVPLLAFLLVGGAVADRFSRRAVLVVANLGSGLTQGAVALVLLSGHYSLAAVAGLSMANGGIEAFTRPALRGVVSELVAPAQIQRAGSLLGSARNATKILGPSVAGLTVVGVGGGVAIAVDAASYLLAAALLTRLPRPGRVPTAGSSLRTELTQGWSYVRNTRWLWTVAVAFAGVNLVQVGPWQILGPTLSPSAATWGFVLTARGVGLLVASLLMYRVVVTRLLRLSQGVAVLGALPLLVLSSGIGPLWLVLAAVVAGAASSVATIGWETTLAEHVPRPMLSRVSAYDELASFAVIPVGQLAVGPLAGAVGATHVALGAGVLYVLLAMAPLAVREVRGLSHPAPSASRRPGRGPAATTQS